MIIAVNNIASRSLNHFNTVAVVWVVMSDYLIHSRKELVLDLKIYNACAGTTDRMVGLYLSRGLGPRSEKQADQNIAYTTVSDLGI